VTLEYRSVPVDTPLPHVIYQNLREAMAWLTKAFGFQEYYRYGDVERRLNVGGQSRYSTKTGRCLRRSSDMELSH
jgi:hypothetical protein